MTASPAPEGTSETLGVLAKLLLGVAIFSAVIGGYFLLLAARSHQPLPDDQVSNGRCIVWLVGSSSIRRWSSAPAQLAGWQVHNRGVEGARLPQLMNRLSSTPIDHSPAAIVLYAGENDLFDGASEVTVAKQLEQLAATLQKRAPQAKIFLASMKPSPTRWNNRRAQVSVDGRLRSFAQANANIYFVDAGEVLLVNGKPGPFYKEDGIHLSPQGYRRWGNQISQHLNINFSDSTDHCADGG